MHQNEIGHEQNTMGAGRLHKSKGICMRPPIRLVGINIYRRGGIRATVVARWAAGQQVKRSVLRQGHDS